MNGLMKKHWFIALALATTLTAHADPSQQVQSSLSELNSDYRSMTDLAPVTDEDGESIVLACDQLMFIDWAEAYMQILEKTQSLDSGAIGEPLTEFGKMYFQAQGDLPVFDMGRKSVLEAIKAELPKVRVGAKPSIADADPTKMRIDDAQEKLFEENINICNQPDFVNQIAAEAPLGNPDVPLPASVFDSGPYTVEWVKSPDGGLKPVRDFGSHTNPCPSGVSCAVGASMQPIGRPVGDFQQILNAIHQHKEVRPYGV